MTNVTNNTKTRHRAYREREIKRLPPPWTGLNCCNMFERWPAVLPTSRLANVLCRSAKKRNEHCTCIYNTYTIHICICFVLSATIQNSAIRMYIPRSFSLIRRKQLGNWPNTYAKRIQKLVNRTLAKRFVGETNVNRSKGDFTWISGRDPLKLILVGESDSHSMNSPNNLRVYFISLWQSLRYKVKF